MPIEGADRRPRAVELLVLLGFLFLPPVARLLGHAPPPLAGITVGLAVIPGVLLADALHKWRRARSLKPPRV